jgi:hypothetical protein
VVEQGPAQAAAGTGWIGRQLLDVQAPVEQDRHDKRGRYIVLVSGYPQQAIALGRGELGQRPRLELRDHGHLDVTEELARFPVHIPEAGNLGRASIPDEHLPIVAGGRQEGVAAGSFGT